MSTWQCGHRTPGKKEKKNTTATLLTCPRPHPLPVFVNYLPFSVISLLSWSRRGGGGKEDGKRKECIWLTQVCCRWWAVWEPRRHCVSCGCVTAVADGGAKKRRAWETCTLTFLNQIWQSGGQPTAYHLQFLLIHNQKLSKWGRDWEKWRGGVVGAGHYISFYWPDERNGELISGH